MMKQWFKKTVTATVMFCSFASVQLSAEEMKTLNFGIISTESSQNLRGMWDPFLKDMEKKLGMEIKPFFAPDYAGIIQGMRFDKVDIAW